MKKAIHFPISVSDFGTLSIGLGGGGEGFFPSTVVRGSYSGNTGLLGGCQRNIRMTHITHWCSYKGSAHLKRGPNSSVYKTKNIEEKTLSKIS